MKNKGEETTQNLQSSSLSVAQKTSWKQAQENIYISIAKGHAMANKPN